MNGVDSSGGPIQRQYAATFRAQPVALFFNYGRSDVLAAGTGRRFAFAVTNVGTETETFALHVNDALMGVPAGAAEQRDISRGRETCEVLSAPVRPALGIASSRLQPSGVPDGATATAPPVTLRRDHLAGGLQVVRAAVRTPRRNRASLRARRSVSILSQPSHSISSYAFTRKTRPRPAVRLACGSDPGSRCRSIPWCRAAWWKEIRGSFRLARDRSGSASRTASCRHIPRLSTDEYHPLLAA
jgi:hypothetical protein